MLVSIFVQLGLVNGGSSVENFFTGRDSGKSVVNGQGNILNIIYSHFAAFNRLLLVQLALVFKRLCVA